MARKKVDFIILIYQRIWIVKLNVYTYVLIMLFKEKTECVQLINCPD